MIEKNRTYNYEEIKEIIDKAEIKVITELESDLRKQAKQAGKEDEFQILMFTMQNMLATASLKREIFRKGEN